MEMEAAVRCFSGVGGPGIDARHAASNNISGLRSLCCRKSTFGGVALGISNFDYFRDKDHLDYYYYDNNNNYSSRGRGGRGGRLEGRKMITCGKGTPCCGNKDIDVVKKAKKDKDRDRETKNKRLKNKKLMKTRLRNIMLQAQGDMPVSSESEMLGCLPDSDNTCFDQVKVARMISDAAELLLEQLQQLGTDSTDLEITRRKASEIISSASCSSSSSSSESSDSDTECGEEVVTVMDCLNKRAQPNASSHPVVFEDEPPLEAEALPPSILVEDRIVKRDLPPSIPIETAPVSVRENENTAAIRQNHLCSGCSPEQEGGRFSGAGQFRRGYVDNKVGFPGTDMMIKSPVVVATAGVVSPSTKKIEVCMGGKCKKSGALALFGEFQRLLGTEGAVSGCKCMGRCRDGPNVRILDDPLHKTPTNALSLCIGVGLEDVDSIVTNYIAQYPEFGLAATCIE